jgi:hypothetical protein
MTKKRMFKVVYFVEAETEGEAEEKFNEVDLETIRDSITIEEVEKPSRIDELEQKAWEKMTGEDVADNLSKEEAEEYYKLLGSQ